MSPILIYTFQVYSLGVLIGLVFLWVVYRMRRDLYHAHKSAILGFFLFWLPIAIYFIVMLVVVAIVPGRWIDKDVMKDH